MCPADNDKFWFTENAEKKTEVSHYRQNVNVPAKTENETAISNVTTAKGHIDAARSTLGIWDRIKFDRQSREVIRKQLAEAFVNMLEAQKQEIIYKFTLQLDDAKKKAFAAYLKESGKVEGQILRLSNDFENQLTDFNLDFGMTLMEKKKEREDRLKASLDAGKINQRDYDRELLNIEKWMDIQRNNLGDKVNMMMANHAKQIQKTLELFTERTIKDH